METEEEGPLLDIQEIPRWAYLSTLEFLDGPRNPKDAGFAGKGILFSRAVQGAPLASANAERLVVLSPSKEHIETQNRSSLRDTRFQVPELSEQDLQMEERIEEEEREKEEERQESMKQKDKLRRLEKEIQEGVKTPQESTLTDTFKTLQKGKRWRLKRPLITSREEQEDLSDTMFYYGRNCGLSSEDMGNLHEEMFDAVNSLEIDNPLSIMVRDVGFPYDRLRVRLNAGLASSNGDRLFDYENDVRVHAGTRAASLFFLPVYYDEAVFGSLSVSVKEKEEEEEEDIDSFAPHEGISFDVSRMVDFMHREKETYPSKLVPLMTLQTCVLLQTYIQALSEPDIGDEGGNVLSVFDFIVGGELVREEFNKARGNVSDGLAALQKVSVRLIFLPIFTGRKLNVPDLSDTMTIHRFKKIYDSLARKSSSAARHIQDIQDNSANRFRPFEELARQAAFLKTKGTPENLTQLEFDMMSLMKLASPQTEVQTLLVHGLGYDGFFVRHEVIGTIVMAELTALHNSIAVDAHVRHIDFGLSRRLGGRLSDRIRQVEARVGFKPYRTSKNMQVHRLFLFPNTDPTRAMISSSYPMPIDSLGSLFQMHSSRGNRVENPLVHFTFWEGSDQTVDRGVGAGIESPKEKDRIVFLEKRKKIRMWLYQNTRLVELSWPFAKKSGSIYPFSVDYYPDIFQREENKSASLRNLFKLSVVLPSSVPTPITTVKNAEKDEKARREPMNRYILSTKGNNTFTLLPTIETPIASVYRMALRELLYNAYHKQIVLGKRHFEGRVKYPPLIHIDDRFPSSESMFLEEEEDEEEIQDSPLYTPIHFSNLLRQIRPSFLSNLAPKTSSRLSEMVLPLVSWFHRVGLELQSTSMGNFTPMLLRESTENKHTDYNFLRFATTMSPMSTQASLLNLWFSCAVALDNVGQEYKPKGLTARGVGAWSVLSSVVPLYSDSMGDLGGGLTESIETFSTFAIVERFQSSLFARKKNSQSNVRRVHLGLLDQFFTSYAGDFRTLFQTHWEMNDDVTTNQSFRCELYNVSPLRAWHLNEIEQLSRIMIAVITYFSFRRHAVFGDFFAMYSHATGIVSGGLGSSSHFSQVSGEEMREHYAKMEHVHQREHFTDASRTAKEVELMENINHMEGWVDSVDHKRRLYDLGAFVLDSLPSWKTTLEFGDARYWERIPKHGRRKEEKHLLWERELEARMEAKTKKSRGTRDLRQEFILLDDKIEDEDARAGFSSWWGQSFSNVKFSEDFTLEDFDPSKWSNYVAYKAIRGLSKNATGPAALSKKQVNLLTQWTCRRNAVKHDPPLKIRHSGDHLKGNGLFCDDPRGIPPGAFILPFDGLLVQHSRIFGTDKERVSSKHYDASDTVFIGEDSWTGEPVYLAPGFSKEDMRETGGPQEIKPHLSRFINGAVSKKIANCAIVKWIVHGTTQFWIVNVYARTIQPGEELLWTYDNSGIDFFKQIGMYSQSAGFVYPPDHLYDYKGSVQMTIENDTPGETVYDPVMKILSHRKEPGKESRVKTAVLLARLEEESEEEEEEGGGGAVFEEGVTVATAEELEKEKRKAAQESREEEAREILAEASRQKPVEIYPLKFEEEIARFSLIHELYSGVAILASKEERIQQGDFSSDTEVFKKGKVDVPRLDFYLSSKREIHQPLPYVTFSNNQTIMIRAKLKENPTRPPRSLSKKFERIQWQRKNLLYYGTPVPRKVLPSTFLVPLFKRLATQYGENAIMKLSPNLEVDDYGNTLHSLYTTESKGNINDTSLSMRVRRQSLIENAGELIEQVNRITEVFFVPRRRVRYEKIEMLLSQEKLDQNQILEEIEKTKDLFLESQDRDMLPRFTSPTDPLLELEVHPRLGESERYEELTTGLTHTPRAKELILNEWVQDAGYLFYAKAHVIARHYYNVYSNHDESDYIQLGGKGTSRSQDRDIPEQFDKSFTDATAEKSFEYIRDYDERHVEKRAVVRYSGDKNKGLGLYATRDILPGEPILPFLGELVTRQEFDERIIKYADDNEHVYEAYEEQVRLTLQRELLGMRARREDVVQGADLVDLEISIRAKLGTMFSESYGIDNPDPLYYAAEFVNINGTQLLVDPQRKGNDARFSNTSRFYNNCTLQFVLVENLDTRTRGSEPYKLVPWIINTFAKPIQANQEILWNYSQHEVDGIDLDYERAPWAVDVATSRVLKHEVATMDIFPKEVSEFVGESKVGVPAGRFPMRKDSPHWVPTFTTEEENNIKESLFKEETYFPYGKETIHRDWSQYRFVMKPNTVDAYSEYSGLLPTTGMEIVRSMLAVTSNFVPEGMSPLSKNGDVLNPLFHDKTLSLGVPTVVKETKVLSDAITMAWCNVCSIMNQLPFRTFESTTIRNHWLAVRAGGLPSEREHSLAEELKESKNKNILAMLLATTNLAIDDLQRRVFGILPSIAKDPARGVSFSDSVQEETAMPSQEQRNFLFLWLASWRTTSALFTNVGQKMKMQIFRTQALLRALGFTAIRFSTKDESDQMYYEMGTESEAKIKIMEAPDLEHLPFYTHVLDGLLANETLVSDPIVLKRHKVPLVERILERGNISPPFVQRTHGEEDSELRDKLAFPIIPDRHDFENVVFEIEETSAVIRALGPSRTFLSPLPSKAYSIDTTEDELKGLIEAANKNLDIAIVHHELQERSSFRITSSDFPAVQNYVEAHYDVMIFQNLERLNALFHLIQESLQTKHPEWNVVDNGPLRVTMHALRAIEILSNEIPTYPEFQEWKRVDGPYIYYAPDKKSHPTPILNEDFIDAEDEDRFGRGPSAYFVLATYAASLYLDIIETYDDIFGFGNELEKGPIVFREEVQVSRTKKVSVGHPWWYTFKLEEEHEDDPTTPESEEEEIDLGTEEEITGLIAGMLVEE